MPKSQRKGYRGGRLSCCGKKVGYRVGDRGYIAGEGEAKYGTDGEVGMLHREEVAGDVGRKRGWRGGRYIEGSLKGAAIDGIIREGAA